MLGEKEVKQPLAVVMLLTDRHKKDTDFKTVRGFCNATSLVSDDVEEVVKRRKVTHVIHLGDLYHRGYQKQDAQYVDTYDDFRLSQMVKGNYYGVVGNHLLLERDANPEFYLIQPNKYPALQPVSDRKFKKPVIKLEDELIIGPVQFSFFHFNKTDKNYYRERKEGIKYHIGLYHDDEVVPNSVRRSCGLSVDVRSEYLRHIYSNIDIGFLGHIHTSIGRVTVKLANEKEVPLYIQGAMCITSSTISEFHKTAKVPILTIYDDSCKMNFEEISLHTDVLTIYREENSIPEANKETYAPKAEKQVAYKVPKEFEGEGIKCTSFEEYVAHIGLGEEYVEIFDLARSDKIADDTVDDILRRYV